MVIAFITCKGEKCMHWRLALSNTKHTGLKGDLDVVFYVLKIKLLSAVVVNVRVVQSLLSGVIICWHFLHKCNREKAYNNI